jgi:hypothetical protein
MKNRKNKKKLRSAAKKLSNKQLLGMGQFMIDRLDEGEKFDEMEKYTLKSLQKEFKKRSEQTKS